MSIMDKEIPLKPILKYPGGKSWIAPGIKYLYKATKSTSFYEPFAGGLSVSLYVGSPRSIIGDINPHVINFYNAIKAGMTFDLEWLNTEEYYYQARERFNVVNKREDAGGIEAAKLYYYLNRSCYNGLNRWSKIKKNFNVPKGKYASLSFMVDFTVYRDRLAGWDLRVGDFSSLLSCVSSDALIYLDPPYYDTFVDYSSEGFSWEDQVRLVQSLRGLERPVIISNNWHPKIVALYRAEGFVVNKVPVRRSISRGPRQDAFEVVAFRGVSAYQRGQFRKRVKNFNK